MCIYRQICIDNIYKNIPIDNMRAIMLSNIYISMYVDSLMDVEWI